LETLLLWLLHQAEQELGCRDHVCAGSDSRGTINGWHCAGANAARLILPALPA
jgi:hypothetical protein